MFQQSNVTWPNKSYIVTVTVFGNLCEEKSTAVIRGEVSVLPPVRATPCHSVCHGQKTFTQQVFVLKNNHRDSQPSWLPTKTSVNFPPENMIINSQPVRLSGGLRGKKTHRHHHHDAYHQASLGAAVHLYSGDAWLCVNNQQPRIG